MPQTELLVVESILGDLILEVSSEILAEVDWRLHCVETVSLLHDQLSEASFDRVDQEIALSELQQQVVVRVDKQTASGRKHVLEFALHLHSVAVHKDLPPKCVVLTLQTCSCDCLVDQGAAVPLRVPTEVRKVFDAAVDTGQLLAAAD